MVVRTTEFQTPRYSHLKQELPNSGLGLIRYFDKRNTGLLSTRKTEAISPHTIMGISCIIVIFCISSITIVVVLINKRISAPNMLILESRTTPDSAASETQSRVENSSEKWSIGKKFCQIFKRSDSEDVIQNDIEEPIESPDHNVFIVSSTENLFHDN